MSAPCPYWDKIRRCMACPWEMGSLLCPFLCHLGSLCLDSSYMAFIYCIITVHYTICSGLRQMRHMEAKRLSNDLGQIGAYVLRCGCGSSITTAVPSAKDARYLCASCCSSSKEKSRLKRIRNETRNTALRQRLD